MARRVRVEKTNITAIAEAQTSGMVQVYEDLEAVYFEVADENAQSAADAVGGLLDLNE